MPVSPIEAKQQAQPSASSLLDEALRHHQAGRLSEAERLYRSVLATDPHHADSLHFLGVIAYQVGKLDMAAELIGKAIAIWSRVPGYHSNHGNVLQAQGKLDEAISSYQRALRLDPRLVDALYNLGNALLAKGRLEEAADQYRQVAKIRPNHAPAHNNLGAILESQGKLEDAVAEYRSAVKIDPKYADAYSNIGNVLRAQGRLEEAATDYETSLKLAPDSAGVHNNLGYVRQSQFRFDEAIACFRRAVSLAPRSSEFQSNLGNVLQIRGRLDEAENCHRLALKLSPNYTEGWNNLGLALQLKGKNEEAETCFDKALSLQPSFAKAKWNKSLSELLRGNFSAGLRDYEARWEIHLPRSFSQPQWRGEPLDGATILLHAEQGLGDTIQFLRYLPMVQATGASVVLEVRQPQIRLAAQIPGVAAVVSKGDALPHFDRHCPLMSLPLAMGTTLSTIPACVPYLSVPPEASKKAAAIPWPEVGLRVGIAWAGSPTHLRDWFRSVSLSMLQPLLDLPGTIFHSLQMGPAVKELDGTKNQIIDLGTSIEDMADTAAIMQQLDLIVGVDTSVVHLAGALGRPVWVLLPFAPDWRWLLHREDSPWYPTVHLFRQPQLNDRYSPIVAIRNSLVSWLEMGRNPLDKKNNIRKDHREA